MTSPEAPAPIIVGGREQLFHLLAEASEIEHTLMCSYLYAAFSLKTAGSAEFSEAERDAVARWRKIILGVATDEMSHLLLVANLSVAVGGRPHFGRPNFPVAPGYFPSGVAVKLTPFSRETLQHFIFLERPVGAAVEDGEGFSDEFQYEREEAFHGLMPSVQDYATVGDLYEALKTNLRASVSRDGEEALFIGPAASQVGPEVVSFEDVGVVTGLESALHAIDAIVEQGEGSPGAREDSHYHRFLTIQREYEELLRANPAFRPAWPAAENPVMRRPPEPEDKVFVQAQPAAQLLDFANAVYSTLLRCLLQGFGRLGPTAATEQKRFIDTAIGLMHMLSDAAIMLAALPATRAHPGVHAGMTFTMLRGVAPFMQGTSEYVLMKERLQELSAGAKAVEAAVPELRGISGRAERMLEKFLA